MNRSIYIKWITAAGFIGIAFGVYYSIFGLGGLPVYQRFVPTESMEAWSRGLYGATFIGFSVLLLLLGRRAIQQKDEQLGRILIFGIATWIIYEAIISLIYGVYINVLIDIALISFLSYPVIKGTRK